MKETGLLHVMVVINLRASRKGLRNRMYPQTVK